MANEPETVEKLKTSYPYVDLIFSPDYIQNLPQMLSELSGNTKKNKKRVIINDNEKSFDFSNTTPLPSQTTENYPQTTSENVYETFSITDNRAFLPIMYGCNNFCTYCIVPYVRGRERSRTPEEILAEVEKLIAKGCKEITLLGQNVNSYGKNSDFDCNFPALLRKINAVDGDFRIRFMSSHPKDATHELFDTIAECDKVCNQIHLPVQSGDDEILRRMNRNYTARQYLEIVEYAKSKVPDIAFTSDIIVGFPGETAEQFQHTLDLVKQVKFNNLFSFIYSKRSGTKASEYPDPITHEEKAERIAEIIELQRKISLENNAKLVGKTLRVLTEGENKGRTESGIVVDFDPTILENPPKIGTFADILITEIKSPYVTGIMTHEQ
jgi:tRNA-2-methylthio-N6-dimethylallyladenosine synthase